MCQSLRADKDRERTAAGLISLLGVEMHKLWNGVSFCRYSSSPQSPQHRAEIYKLCIWLWEVCPGTYQEAVGRCMRSDAPKGLPWRRMAHGRIILAEASKPRTIQKQLYPDFSEQEDTRVVVNLWIGASMCLAMLCSGHRWLIFHNLTSLGWRV